MTIYIRTLVYSRVLASTFLYICIPSNVEAAVKCPGLANSVSYKD